MILLRLLRLRLIRLLLLLRLMLVLLLVLLMMVLMLLLRCMLLFLLMILRVRLMVRLCFRLFLMSLLLLLLLVLLRRLPLLLLLVRRMLLLLPLLLVLCTPLPRRLLVAAVPACDAAADASVHCAGPPGAGLDALIWRCPEWLRCSARGRNLPGRRRVPGAAGGRGGNRSNTSSSAHGPQRQITTMIQHTSAGVGGWRCHCGRGRARASAEHEGVAVCRVSQRATPAEALVSPPTTLQATAVLSVAAGKGRNFRRPAAAHSGPMYALVVCWLMRMRVRMSMCLLR